MSLILNSITKHSPHRWVMVIVALLGSAESASVLSNDAVLRAPAVEVFETTGPSVTLVELPPSETKGSWTPPSSLTAPVVGDRIWLVSTRHLSNDACRINLQNPRFQIYRLDRCGRANHSSLDEYLSTMQRSRPRLVYVHGNRRPADVAIERGLDVYRELDRNCQSDVPIDWVIWSWDSNAVALPIRDAKIKADRADAQGLYLAWLLFQHVQAGQPTSLIGFSFGGRIVTGSLHALAGGSIDGRRLGLSPIIDAGIDVGLLAPAVPTAWLTRSGQHRLAMQNMDEMVLIYNHRDLILKNYWLVDRVPGSQALGYSGPIAFAPRADGSPLPVRSRDCASTVGTKHSESEYYDHSCCAGREMATLLESCLTRR